MAAKRIVLMVEAHEDSRVMYAEFLEQHRIAVIAVPTADEAIPLLVHADLLITELVLIGSARDGLELIRRVRADETTRRLPIIVLSASAALSERQGALSAGADIVLLKPCTPERLLEMVRWLLARHVSAADGKSGES